MKKLFKSLSLLLVFFNVVIACDVIDTDLDTQPKGVINSENLEGSPEAADALVVAAYAALSNVYDDGLFPPISAIFYPASNWSFGDVRSDDAYKGGGGTGDIGELNSLERGDVFPSNTLVLQKWQALYVAISRTNKALKALNNFTTDEFPEVNTRIAEVRALRGHFYFELKRHFFTYPYIDENVEEGEEKNIPNDLSSEQLWNKIIEDFSSAISNLPENQPEIARINKSIAQAYMAKVYMYLKRYSDAITQIDNVMNSGKYQLLDDMEALYSDPNVERNGEVIFAIETNIGGGGAFNGNFNWGDLLTSPPGPAYGGGDGFHRPSQNLVNAYKVDADGLPFLNSFNDSDFEPDDTITPIDPRLDHAIGRPGIPWKDFTGEVYGSNWIRDGATYGPYSKKKNLISPNSELRGAEGFPWARGALNFPIIKYSEVLLWKAEALIESGGDLNEARDLINRIRERAMNTPKVMKLDGNGAAANYNIGLYTAQEWTREYARKALRMERRLELSLEGHRFYDLVRWGTSANILNKYFATESLKRGFLSDANFVENRNEYLPIPSIEIDKSGGGLKQSIFFQ